MRAARRRASERADGKAATGKGWRKRTSHRPSGREMASRSKAPWTWRFSRLRVTARRAWRLGTTQPIQCAVGKSSTGGGQPGAGPVDNSAESAFSARCRTAGTGTLGDTGRWCTAKWALRAQGRAPSRRSKSALFTRRAVTAAPEGSMGEDAAKPRNSDCQPLATLGAARIDDGTAATGLHAHEKPVGTGAADLRGLVGALHGGLRRGLRFTRAGCRNRQCSRRARLWCGLATRDFSALPRHLITLTTLALLFFPPKMDSGNPRLQQKTSMRSNTCTAGWPHARGLTALSNVWITAFRRPRGASESAAHDKRYPQ